NDCEAVSPVGEIRFLRITSRGIARKPRSDDEVCSGAQQFDSCLVPNLDAAAGEQRHPPAQIRELTAFAEIQLRTRRAKLIVEMMDRGVILFADVTILRLQDFAKLRVVLDLLLFELQRR